MKQSLFFILIFLLLLASSAYSQTAQEYIDRGNSESNLQNYRGAIANEINEQMIVPIN
jgi:hypothetical protein